MNLETIVKDLLLIVADLNKYIEEQKPTPWRYHDTCTCLGKIYSENGVCKGCGKRVNC